MKVRKLKDGEMIEAGDRIKVEHRGMGGTHWYTVARTTKAYAFVRCSEFSESKYWREYQDFGFCPLPRDKWLMTSYSAWRRIPTGDAAGQSNTQE